MELTPHSINLRASFQERMKRRISLKGYLIMWISVLGLVINHIFAKLAYEENSSVTNIDCMLFLGITTAPLYCFIAWYKSYTLNLLSFPFKAIMIIILSVIIDFSTNYWMLKGISLLSISKSSLVFSWNSLYSVFLVNAHSGENNLHFVPIIGTFIGIFFITLNKSIDESDDEMFYGFIYVIVGALLQACLWIVVRIMSINQIHYVIRSAYTGVTTLVISLIIVLFIPDSSSSLDYDFEDFIYILISSVGYWIWTITLSLALKYK